MTRKLLIWVLSVVATYESFAQQAGDMAPNAVAIDADFIGQFSDGFCVVMKGNQTGVIDRKGKFVLPYGSQVRPSCFRVTRKPICTDGRPAADAFYSGRLLVMDEQTKLLGYMDTTFKVVIPCKYPEAQNFENGYAMVSDGYNTQHIDGAGGKVSQRLVKCSNEDLYAINGSMGQGIGFTKGGLEDPLLVPGEFKQVTSFSEGLAAVSVSDLYGGRKWGFIDHSGKMVIPPTFTNQPSAFHEGLAMVVPNDQGDFEYAYIDPTGAVVLKISKKEFPKATLITGYSRMAPYERFYLGDCSTRTDRRNAWSYGMFVGGRARVIGTDAIINKDGSIWPGPSGYFDEFGEQITNVPGVGKGLVRYPNTVLIPSVLLELSSRQDSTDLYKARHVYKDAKGMRKERVGFVNDAGLFVIVKAEPAQW